MTSELRLLPEGDNTDQSTGEFYSTDENDIKRATPVCSLSNRSVHVSGSPVVASKRILNELEDLQNNPPTSCSAVSMEKKSDWAGLHCDFLIPIYKLLPLGDRLRVKAVHPSWNEAATILEREIKPKAPWLMVRLTTEVDTSIHINNNSYRFFSLEEEKMYTLNMNELGDIHCVGSDNGWLLLIDKTLNLYLFNPFTRSQVELPSVVGTFIQTRRNLTSEENEYIFIPNWFDLEYDWCTATEIRQHIFSGPHLCIGENNKDYLVVVMYQEAFIAFCRRGDKRWTELDNKYRLSSDLLYKDNMLYIAPLFDSDVEMWDMNRPVPSRTKVINFEIPYNTGPPVVNSYEYAGARLVSSDNDLLMVLSCDYYSDGYELDFSRKLFFVYKLDDSKNEWKRIDSLGDRVLFLQSHNSISLVARDINGAKENSIYFDNSTRDSNVGYVGVFDMETGVVTLMCQNEFGRSFNQHFWIVPDLTVI